ncbi:polyubiquitin-tagged protein recognition complex, Npl4 component [Jaminaea rosea]|uniref:Nuclear protein localization protein 4 n=1 Tax=Jaminaea rosea TaxID=1569628 RepID=A0A316UN46_9BASI|nr:polyubiquitin-tagged protein recognition complex, Npl4 component [Jaminaea rosea]PWN26228.1 polyubiquitin-tagged protein recognition complex, Npl4 component [Jaminaea rosea]
MLVRVRSKDGSFRFPLEPTDDVAKLIDKVLETAPNADAATLTFSNEPRGGEQDANGLKGNTLGDLGITHGHLLYIAYKEQAQKQVASQEQPDEQPSSSNAVNGTPAITPAASASGSSAKPVSLTRPWENVREDAVDAYWSRKDGMIPRPKDTKFCRHGDKAMCDYCMPLEPYDAKYHAENNIKHSSFHAYLKKLNIATNASKPAQTYIPPLEEPNYSVRVPCPSGQHPPWPAGICTKCQPSAITLQSQEFRMVDHVEFSHPQLIENLLAFWRATGTQRYGFLLGHYEPYEVVPMGIKAVVEAIHEPPQEGETDGLTLGVPWEDQARVERLASACGLQVVGQIYTDLTPADPTFTDPSKAGLVLCKRHKDSFFISSLETTFAAQLQAANSNPSRHSMTGRFGSKFVTCVLSGTEEGAIDVSAYQISEQGVGMVKTDMIEASVSPGIVRVKPSEGERYVPEVFYRYKNEYKIDVKESAKPTFPVEYLLVTLTNGFPTQPSPRFLSTTPFAIENRPGLHDQDLNKALAAIASAIGGEDEDLDAGANADMKRQKLVGVLSDWHLVAFLDSSDMLEPKDVEALCRVAVSHDEGKALDELRERAGWKNLIAIARANVANGIGNSNGAAPSTSTSAPADEFTYTGSDDEDMNFEDLDDDDDDGGSVGGFEDANDDAFEDATSAVSAERRGGRSSTSTRTAPAPAPAPAAAPPQPPAAAAAPSMVACPHCTFENAPGSSDCDVCGLPLSG